MINAIKEVKEFEKNLATLRKSIETFKVKRDEISKQHEETKQKTEQAEARFKNALVDKVKGFASDDSIKELRDQVSNLKQSAKNSEEQLEAILTMLDENAEEEKKLVGLKPRMRFNFLQVALQDALSGIKEETRELLREAWMIKSHLPGGGYPKFLSEVFPPDRIEEKKNRWDRFIAKHNYIEH
ncbi:MAG: hypothetical protein SRB2_02137 [Desulfobacteraceae bacterium Eth-SRB2]|nr:MAG: hypothetical protein SRB2_02137 [Desulfobacteraceae bacterium Eth-SRB2]